MNTANDIENLPSTQKGSATVENPKRTRPSLDERLAQIAKRKAALEKAEARLIAETRKERTGQLIAWGLWVEHYCQTSSENNRQTVEGLVCGYLKDRNLERAKAGFTRVRGGRPEKDTIKESNNFVIHTSVYYLRIR